MKAAAFFAVLLAALWSAALQGQSLENSTPAQSPGQQTIRGCLSGSGSTYTLTEESGKTWPIQASADTLNNMKDHVGQQVSLTGMPVSASTSTEGPAASASSSSPPNLAAFQVRSFEKIADRCSENGSTGAESAGTRATGGTAGMATMEGSAARETAEAQEAASVAGGPPPITSQTPTASTPPTNQQRGATGLPRAGSSDIGVSSGGQGNNANQYPPPRVITDQPELEVTPEADSGRQPPRSSNLPETASPLPLMTLAGVGAMLAGLLGRVAK